MKQRDPDFGFQVSEQLGRSSSKEQYAFFYRQSKVKILERWQYPDAKNAFERPPFFVRFADLNDQFNVAFGNIHTKPEDTPNELGNLTLVYDEIFWKWQPTFVLFGGDMNADCSYVANYKWNSIPLWTNSTWFTWLIGTDADSTQAASSCSCNFCFISYKKITFD